MDATTPVLPPTRVLRAMVASPWLWAGLTAFALLAAYVHTLNDAILRGSLQHQAQRVADRVHAAAARRGATVQDAVLEPSERVAIVSPR